MYIVDELRLAEVPGCLSRLLLVLCIIVLQLLIVCIDVHLDAH